MDKNRHIITPHYVFDNNFLGAKIRPENAKKPKERMVTDTVQPTIYAEIVRNTERPHATIGAKEKQGLIRTIFSWKGYIVAIVAVFICIWLSDTTHDKFYWDLGSKILGISTIIGFPLLIWRQNKKYKDEHRHWPRQNNSRHVTGYKFGYDECGVGPQYGAYDLSGASINSIFRHDD